MTTLPATIPGLVRFCTPLWFCDEVTQWVALNYGPATNGSPDFFMVTAVPKSIFGLAITTDPSDWAVDLTDPTGFHHALLWLAEKLGMDASCGLWWRWSTIYECWRMDTPKTHWAFGKHAFDRHGRYTVVDLAPMMDRAESLRLAVLAVAGVQG